MAAMGATAGAWLARPTMFLARPAPAGRVAVGTCHEYGPEVVGVLGNMFDQLGGLEGLVRGKTVAIKLNLTGLATDRLGYTPPGITHWVHPQVIGATVHLLAKAGAQRIRLLESAYVNGRAAGRIHAPGQLGTARLPERGAAGGI